MRGIAAVASAVLRRRIQTQPHRADECEHPHRAVLERVRGLIVEHATEVSIFAPDAAFAEAREHLPGLLEKRGVGGGAVLATLEQAVRPPCVRR